MSNKTNLITIRKKQNFFLNFSNQNTKIFTFILNFMNFFKQVLLLKNIYLDKESLNISTNKMFLKGNILFNSKILKKYEKRLDKFHNYQLISENQIYKKICRNFNITNIYYNFKVLNHLINIENLSILYHKFGKFIQSSFFKNQKIYFLDFLKIITLYNDNKISLNSILYYISKLLPNIKKKDYSKFFSFLTSILTFIINNFKKTTVKGIKMTISGRLNINNKATSRTTYIGSISIQKLDNNIEYGKTTIFTTRYGTFGYKLWVLKNVT